MAIQGQWKLSNGVWTDISGNGNTLTAVGTVSQQTGHGGGANLAAGFNGSSNLQITDAAQTGLDTNLTGLTLAARFKLGALGSVQHIISKYIADGETTDLCYNLRLEPDNKLKFYVAKVATTWAANCVSDTTFATGTWYHVFAIYNGSNIQLYVNNVADGSPVSITGTLRDGGSWTLFTIGGNNSYGATRIANGGVIDDVVVANHAFDSSERATFYGYGDDFPTAVTFGGDLACVASLAGNLSVETYLYGGVSAVSNLTGIITTGIRMASPLACVASLTGNLQVFGWGSDVASEATLTGDLETGINMAANITMTSTLHGSMQVGEVTEDIDWLIQDSTGLLTGVSGLTSLKIVKRANNSILDWNDLVFKTSGWVSSSTSLSEVDAVNQPGLYRKNISIGDWVAGKYYLLLSYSGSPVQHYGVEFTIENGKLISDYLVGKVDATITSRATQTSVDAIPTTAPDNAGIAANGAALTAMQGDIDFLLAVIRNKRYLEKVGSTWYLVIRNDGDTADILRKALKGTDGTTEITDIQATALGMEMKSSV